MPGLAISSDCIPTSLRASQLWQIALPQTQKGHVQGTTIPNGRTEMEDTKDTSTCLWLHKITLDILPSAFTSKLYCFTKTKWELLCCLVKIQAWKKNVVSLLYNYSYFVIFLTFHWFCFCNTRPKHHEYSSSSKMQLQFHINRQENL
jgi:hypothetical protein